jgi:uncharacterized damage-inducible protein DinB
MITAENIRSLYEYHFTLNRRLWDTSILTLTEEQFTQKLDYSVGSIRNQMVHLLNVDERWFCGLRGVEVPGFLNPVHFPDRAQVRARWDMVEADMRGYLATLSDPRLAEMYQEPFRVWQVLLHVVNHGTDHRAQTLAMLHTLGARTFPQDYAYFVMGVDPTKRD